MDVKRRDLDNPVFNDNFVFNCQNKIVIFLFFSKISKKKSVLKS